MFSSLDMIPAVLQSIVVGHMIADERRSNLHTGLDESRRVRALLLMLLFVVRCCHFFSLRIDMFAAECTSLHGVGQPRFRLFKLDAEIFWAHQGQDFWSAAVAGVLLIYWNFWNTSSEKEIIVAANITSIPPCTSSASGFRSAAGPFLLVSVTEFVRIFEAV